MARQVFLAYTTSETLKSPELIRIYAKQSYKAAYNWIADLAERYGNHLQPFGLKYPTSGVKAVVIETVNPNNGQRWWLERHEVV